MERTKLKVTSYFNNFLDGCVQKRDRVGHRALKSAASQEWIDESSWFCVLIADSDVIIFVKSLWLLNSGTEGGGVHCHFTC